MNEKYDVFISYRRDGGESTAKILHDKLENLGYNVFFDVESLRSGNFNTALYSVIDNCKDFLLVLSPGALDRCNNENDWVRLEIEHALEKGLNIVPVMLRGFSFPQELPPSIDEVRYKNGIEASYNFFDAFIDKLRNFLEASPSIARRRKPKHLIIGAVLTAFLGISLVIGLVNRPNADSGSQKKNPYKNNSNSESDSGSQQDNSNDGNSTSATNDKYKYVDNGDNSVTLTKYDDSDNVADVEIPKELGGKTVAIIESKAFENCNNLKTVKFPLSVKEIKEDAFYNCPNLEKIEVSAACNLSESVTKNCSAEVRIDRVTYYESVANSDTSCSLTKYVSGDSLTDVEIPSIASGKTVTIIEAYAFENYENLRTVVVPDSVTEIKENAFCNCPNLMKIKIPKDCKVNENALYNCGKVNIERRN